MGIGYLAEVQERDGSFSSSVSAKRNFKNTFQNQSLFSSCLILSSLASLPKTEDTKKIQNRLARFIESQKSDFWSWNYWKRNSLESRTNAYPDDLDDTCCAVAALTLYNPKVVSTQAVAKIVNLLAFCEKGVGGPYYSWIVPGETEKAWKDIDLAVNNNIAFFLSLHEVTLPSLVDLTEKSIRSQKYQSPYYYSPQVVIYFISRWYRGRKKDKIISFLLRKRLKNFSWGNPLETVLSVSALINLGYKEKDLEKSINFIGKNCSNGSWKAYPFVIEKIKREEKYFSGSQALTTAFCLEALGKFLVQSEAVEDSGKIRKIDVHKNVHNKIIQLTNQRFSRLPAELRENFLLVRRRVLRGDKAHQTTLMPYYFQESGKKGGSPDKDLVIKLGAANLYGWVAYSIYDDFLDEEGNPKFLPVANICLRELVSLYGSIFAGKEDFLKFFRNILDRIESANIWEATNCRVRVFNSQLAVPQKFPDYENLEKLADRSIGHALGPVALLYLMEKDIASPKIKNLVAFFENYIIARQLNDDAHDWEEDLKKRRLSPVVVLILKKYLKDEKNIKTLDLRKELKKLQQIFWYEVVQETSKKSILYIKEARRCLRNMDYLKNKNFLEKMLLPVEKSAQKALLEQREMSDFLKEYK